MPGLRFPNHLLYFARPVAWFAAISLMAWVCATLVERWLSSSPQAIPPAYASDPRVAARMISAKFGGETGQARSTAAQLTSTQTAAAQAFELIGVATGFQGGEGFAILRASNGELTSVVIGQALSDNRVVSAILADAIELDHNGVLERLTLARPRSPQ